MILNDLKDRLEQLHERSWVSMRIMRQFTIPDLVRTTALDIDKIDHTVLYIWLKVLEKHQYISSNKNMEGKTDGILSFRLNCDIGPNRPIICEKCNKMLFPLFMPIMLQVMRDAYWFQAINCKNAYVSSMNPITSEDYVIYDYFVNVNDGVLWQLKNEGWVLSNQKLDANQLEHLTKEYEMLKNRDINLLSPFFENV